MITVTSIELSIKRDEDEGTEFIWDIPEKYIDRVDTKKLMSLPCRLPMLVKPKPHSSNKLGGYLSNDIYENDPLVVNKIAYKTPSTINQSLIYDVVNKISQIPFMINKDLLEFLSDYDRSVELGLLQPFLN